MLSPQVLREWCSVTCTGYPDVEVKDWSSSFQSGLALCAIIHKHRPELIDFSTLSKDNAYGNNKTAFELAETELGIPMLLNAEEITSAPEPDHLVVMTYLSHFYFLFNRKSIDDASVPSLSHTIVTGSRNSKSLTHLASTGKYSSSDSKPRVTCNLCCKPVHLIQRRVVEGKVCHRKCLRCRLCHLPLLPGNKGTTAKSMICPNHIKHHRESMSKQKDSYLSLSGLAISSVPHYSVKTEPPDKQVCKEGEICSAFGMQSSVHKSARDGIGEHVCNDGKLEAGIAAEDSKSRLGGDPDCRGPVPAPRRSVTSYGTTAAPNMAASGPPGTSVKTSGSAPAVRLLGSGPTRGSGQVKTNHPWLKIIHPGPWTQLPPAPPLVHPLRAKSVSSLSGVWYKPRASAPNPFDEETNDAPQQNTTADDSKLEDVTDIIDLEVQSNKACAGEAESPSKAAMAFSDPVEEHAPCSTEPDDKDPALLCGTPVELPCHDPDVWKQGFPLIKRKVQTELCSSSKDLQKQMGRVATELQALEEQGVELERDLRHCSNNTEEEKLLMDWFSLVHQKHILERKDKELVFQVQQRELEQSQEDVEFHLRCLFNKPEGEWSEQDRRQEQRLMTELLHIIEQRNQMISRLDQDVHREREDDLNWETIVKNKDVQRSELKELKKSKGMFKTTSVLQILNKKSKSKREKKS